MIKIVYLLALSMYVIPAVGILRYSSQLFTIVLICFQLLAYCVALRLIHSIQIHTFGTVRPHASTATNARFATLLSMSAVLAATLILVGSAFFVPWILYLLRGNALQPTQYRSVTAYSIVLIVLSVINEELFFRKLTFRFLQSVTPAHTVFIVGSSLLFALAHIHLGAIVVVHAVIGGVVLAWLFWRFQNIYYTIIAHGVANLIILAVRAYI